MYGRDRTSWSCKWLSVLLTQNEIFHGTIIIIINVEHALRGEAKWPSMSASVCIRVFHLPLFKKGDFIFIFVLKSASISMRISKHTWDFRGVKVHC